MATLTTVEFIRQDHQLKKQIPTDQFLENRMLEASVRMIQLVGVSQYSAAVEALKIGSPAAEYRKAEILRLAESKLVMFFGLLHFFQISENGVIQEAASKTFSDATFRVANHTEIEKMRKSFWDQACGLIREYMVEP